MEDEREEYYIPANYNNSGRYLWGLTSGRNLLEMVIVLVPTILIVYPLVNGLALRTRVIVLLLIIFGLGAPLAIGIDGGSVGQYLYRIIRFMFANKKYSMERINEPAPKPEEPEKVPEEAQEGEGAEKKADEESGTEKKKPRAGIKDRAIEKMIAGLERIRSKEDGKKEEDE